MNTIGQQSEMLRSELMAVRAEDARATEAWLAAINDRNATESEILGLSQKMAEIAERRSGSRARLACLA